MDAGGMVIERNTEALRRILALVFVYLGLADNTGHASRLLSGGEAAQRAFEAMTQGETLPRRVHRLVRLLLLPVEAATRRLVVALAAGMPVPGLPKWERIRLTRSLTKPIVVQVPRSWEPGIMIPQHLLAEQRREEKRPVRLPRFSLLDPLKRYDRKRRARRISIPRIGSAGSPFHRIPEWRPQTGNDPVPDRHLLRRAAAVAGALADLPRQAQQFAQWRVRRDFCVNAAKGPPPRRVHALRIGRPPGSPPMRLPKEQWSEQQAVLSECHSLACNAPQIRAPTG